MKCHTVDGIQIRVEEKKLPFASRKFYLVFVIRYICGGQRAVTTTLTMTTAKIIMDKLVIPIHILILILMLTLPYTNRSLNFGSVVCMSSVHSDRMFFVALQIVVFCLVFAVWMRQINSIDLKIGRNKTLAKMQRIGRYAVLSTDTQTTHAHTHTGVDRMKNKLCYSFLWEYFTTCLSLLLRFFRCLLSRAKGQIDMYMQVIPYSLLC